MPVRLGVPHAVAGLSDMVRNPIHSTGVGLLQFGHRHGAHRMPADSEGRGFQAVMRRMKSWFEGNF
jgi:cell division protein FtsA